MVPDTLGRFTDHRRVTRPILRYAGAMKTRRFAVLILVVASAASADVIRCAFTEPFISMTYSMTQSTIDVVTPDGNESITGVSFQILGPGQFAFWDAAKAPVLTLSLDYRGSDGMSETIYPYSAVRTWEGGGQDGGCWSNNLPRVGLEQ